MRPVKGCETSGVRVSPTRPVQVGKSHYYEVNEPLRAHNAARAESIVDRKLLENLRGFEDDAWIRIAQACVG
jgi:hypothetical protein